MMKLGTVAAVEASNKESESLGFLSSFSNRSLAVSFSGGKDSLVALDIAHRIGVKKVVFCDTTIEFPETVEYIREIEEFYGLEIDIVKPPVAFFDLVSEIGVPSRRSRWCCEVFKFGPLSAYARKEGVHGFITGLRSQESIRRRSYSSEDRIFLTSSTQINPILNWTGDDIWDYIEKYNLPANPLYEHFDRVGCWCCPYRSKSDWEATERIHPELAEQFNVLLEFHSYGRHISDRGKYVKDRGWTGWISAQKRTLMGLSEPCQSPSENGLTLVLTFDSREEAEIVSRVLPIVSKDWRIIGRRIRLNIRRGHREKARILVEKALNCVSCGVCPNLCPTQALSCSESGLSVAADSCSQCVRCLSATVNTLRGACIARNYGSQKRILAEV
ncbi:MAG: phosphoadenosine phosphosulfate reductase domain-containing protein [Candidatus Thorarchaeota archaeon]|jgi:phosphoadenosine phosphosulfate reductase